MTVLSDDGVHLEVPEPFPVGLRRPFRDADPVGNGYAASSDGPLPVLQAMAAVPVEVASFSPVAAYPAVDGLMRDVHAVQGQMTGDLLRRPLVLSQEAESFLPRLLADGMVAGMTTPLMISVLLCRLSIVATVTAAVASQLTGNRAWTHSYRICDSFFFIPFWSKMEIAYLCSVVNRLYISNAKLIDLRGGSGLPIPFFALPVEFFLLLCFQVLFIPLTQHKNCSSMLNLRLHTMVLD